jgi:hypothetical protein
VVDRNLGQMNPKRSLEDDHYLYDHQHFEGLASFLTEEVDAYGLNAQTRDDGG